mgnify:CR=1 FL=1|tara:strand:- start:7807 stop:8466 length:660 start_codon:yes stop_codon:yes gene_type:complete
MTGWIKIDRKVFEHWIFSDAWKFRNWIDLIGLVNYTDVKVEIGGVLFLCKRGQSLRSMQTLANRWKCDKSKVRRFLKLLESDGMIVLVNEHKTTRITICNYDSYQVDEIAEKTQTPRKQIADESQTKTNKNNKKNKEEKEKDFKTLLVPFLGEYGKDMLNEFYMYWTEVTPKGKLRYEEQSAFSLTRRLTTWRNNQKKYENGSEDDLMKHVQSQMGGAK